MKRVIGKATYEYEEVCDECGEGSLQDDLLENYNWLGREIRLHRYCVTKVLQGVFNAHHREGNNINYNV